MTFLAVVTTIDSEAAARAIATESVRQHLAACVQIVGPITSFYRWEGVIETATEYRCEMKTNEQNVSALHSLVRELHSYDVPEFVTMPLIKVGDDYADWMNEQLKDSK